MLSKKIIENLATAFGLGKMPRAPGTFGTLAGIPIAVLLGWSGNKFVYAAGIIGLFIIAVHVSDEAEKIYKKKDAQQIVIDEVLGYVVTMFAVPINPLNLFLAFVLFRFFDITKIYPINKLQRFHGGFGVVVDDFAAGVYAAIILQILLILKFI